MNETRNCQNCKKDFTIEPDDFSFYEKIKVPPPTWCPECRFQRRLSFLNWFSLYRRKCDSCNTDMISSINSDSTDRVFCQKCWWADDWDGTEYGIDYDPTRPFLEQMMELRNRSNFMSNESLYSSLVNSPYVNATAYQKDCFMVFNADYGEKTAYCMVFAHLKECLEGYRSKSSELCYECTGVHKSYHCIFSEEIDSCTDVYFSRACFGCTDCFGCINLRNKSYHIFNQKYSKEDYFEKLKSFKLNTIDGVKEALKKSYDFWITKPQRAVIGNSMNVNTTGDFVYESKNTKDGYLISEVEDSRYVQMITMGTTKGCYDYTNWGNNVENLYECLTVGDGASGNKFCVQCWPNALNNEYSMYTIQSKDCFGCVNLKRKQYCILNKQYSKSEYEELKKHIIEDMKLNPYIDKYGREWKYGEQLPIGFSPFSYNETIAQYFFPLTEDEAKSKNISWYKNIDTKYEISMNFRDVPQDIENVSDSILKEIIECSTCGKGYKFNDLELMLYRKIRTPLATSCWRCRFKRRFDRVNGFKLYNRNCYKCNKDIKTSYAPDRPEIIYCESCYQQEVN